MARFNQASTTKRIVNRAGGEAFEQSNELKLVSILLTSFVKDQYYRSGKTTLKELTDAISAVDPLFAAKAVIYARNEFGMRSITHAGVVDVCRRVKGEEWAKNFVDKAVRRPDDMMEILSRYYQVNEGKKLTMNLKKGLAKAFAKFNKYQLAKYRGEGKDVSLVDVANLVHPTGGDQEAIAKLVAGTLRSQDTWESGLTKAGQKAKTDKEKEQLKADVWKDLVTTKKIGYFALLRNLRNIIEQAPDILPEALGLLTNPERISKSLVLPFRFATASKTLQGEGINSPETYKALSKALDLSMGNVPVFDGKTLVVVDASGSMGSVEHGNLTNFEIGALFAVALAKTNASDIMYFGTLAKYAGINPEDSTITLVEHLKRLNQGWSEDAGGTNVGHGTNFHAIFDEAREAYDRIVIFSDMQGWVGYHAPTKSFENYKKRTGANPHIYSIDLSGYGSAQFPENMIYQLSGFSDKIFSLMSLLETDKQALVNEIKKIEL